MIGEINTIWDTSLRSVGLKDTQNCFIFSVFDSSTGNAVLNAVWLLPTTRTDWAGLKNWQKLTDRLTQLMMPVSVK